MIMTSKSDMLDLNAFDPQALFRWRQAGLYGHAVDTNETALTCADTAEISRIRTKRVAAKAIDSGRAQSRGNALTITK